MRTIDRAGALCVLVILGCGEPIPGSDGGPRDGGGSVDAPPVQCERSADCQDSLFCTEHACMPGAPSADARGCVLEDGPCAPGEMCVEGPPGMCVAEECTGDPDPDDDDEPSFACGGHDCADDDGNRYPGNPEVCDAEGHDEDCVPDTIAGESDGDLDDDGYTSATCCNGATCGDDCDDDDPAVHPGARELCNGRDDDCNGAVDDAGATPLCPGGTCTAGRCSLVGWDRTFGGTSFDRGFSVTMDESGDVYAVGTFSGSATFGGAGGPVTSVAGSDDIFVASFGPDGSYRWVRTFGSPGFDRGLDVAFDPTSAVVFFTALTETPVDYGGGAGPGSAPEATIVALERDGTYAWGRTMPFAFPMLTVAAGDGVAVAGSFDEPHDFGDGLRAPVGNDGFVARYAADGAFRWITTFATTGAITPFRVAIDASGRVLAAGVYGSGAPDFGAGPRPHRGGLDVFVLALEPSGSLAWDYTAGGPGDDIANAVAADTLGQPFVVGAFEATVDFGGGPVTAPASQSAFLLALTSSGEFRRVTTWGGGSENEAIAVAVESTGNPIVAGYFEGSVNFGGGPRSAPTGGAAFYVGFDTALNHRYDAAFEYPGLCPAARCTSVAGDLAIGPADSTVITGEFFGSIDFGSGPRTSAGENDGFVVRLSR